jgi:acyl carrier protein
MDDLWIGKVRLVLQNVSDLKPKMRVDNITVDSRFREDLGFDSLAMAAFFYELQDQYNYLDESEVKNWKKVSDCIESLKSGL